MARHWRLGFISRDGKREAIMADEKQYTYSLFDETKRTSDGFCLSEEGGPATEATIEECVKRYYPSPYFVEDDERILIFRSKEESDDAKNSVGEVHLVE